MANAILQSSPISHQLQLATDKVASNTELSKEKGKSLASEFESVFFSMLIKSMRSSMTEEGLFGSEASDTYGGLFDLYMGKHLAESNGLGISSMLESYNLEGQNNDGSTNNSENEPGLKLGE